MREDAQKGQRQEVVFRRMEAADVAAAAQVEAVSSREAWTEKAFLDAVRRPDVVYVVAQRGERVVGCCGLWESFDEISAMWLSCRNADGRGSPMGCFFF